jgi:hypothetical protein
MHAYMTCRKRLMLNSAINTEALRPFLILERQTDPVNAPNSAVRNVRAFEMVANMMAQRAT